MTAKSLDNVQAISMSEAERKSGKYSPETLIKVLNAMNQDGLVVLKDVIPVDIIDDLNVKMCEDAERMLKDPSQEFNHGVRSNILQRPPITEPEYMHKEIYFNPFVLQLANAYLGHRPVWNWLTANNALGQTGGMRQPAHKDGSFNHPLFPYYFIANIPLCDFNIHNGATEFWLGSHAHTTYLDQQIGATPESVKPYVNAVLGGRIPPITEEAKEARRLVRAPIQPACSRGDVMIRDLRTWHAGMPNMSDSHRIMLALGYQSPYHPNYKLRVHLPFSQRGFFLENAGESVEVRAQWYSDEELAKTKADTIFVTRPDYLDEEASMLAA